MMATRRSRRTLLLTSLLPLLCTAHPDPVRWRASRTSTLDFGSCNDPGITWDYDLGGSQQYGFAPTNQTQFPHGFSPDVSTLEIYICNRLQWVCGASPPTIQACRNAFELYSGLSGENAADSWNEALGLYGITPTSARTDYGATTTVVATVLVSGTSVPYSTLFSAISTVFTESLSSSLLNSYVSPTYTVYSMHTISQDPISTLTVKSSASLSVMSTSTVVLPLSMSSSSVETSTSIIVPTAGTAVTTTSYSSTTTAQPQSTDTGSGDGGGSPFSEAIVLQPLSGLVMAWLVVPAFLMLFA